MLNLTPEEKQLLTKTTADNLSLIKKNQLLQSIKEDLLKMKKELPSHHQYDLRRLIHKIDFNLHKKNEEFQLVRILNNIDPEFLSKLRTQHPELTQADWKHCSMIKLGLSVKETSILFYKSPKAVEMIRYRLKKKLNLSSKESLTKYLMNI